MARRHHRSRYARYDRYDRYDSYGGWGGFPPYVSVAERRLKALRKLDGLRKAGKTVSPVKIAGRKIATTFWGGAWCDNLERYSDYANRIPRGRTYVRNGSVIDLQIGAGQVNALVSGSEIYKVQVTVAPVRAARWRTICSRCAGGIDSLVELLQGRFSKPVMAHLCQQGTGLFPTPREIQFTCSCPDWASMCKHVAAVLYGVGARLDHQPDLLFRLRQVDEQDLIARAGTGVPLSRKGPAPSRVLADNELADVFGVEIATPVTPAHAAATTEGSRVPARKRLRVAAAVGTSASQPVPAAVSKKSGRSHKRPKSPGLEKPPRTPGISAGATRPAGTTPAKRGRTARSRQSVPAVVPPAGTRATRRQPQSEKKRR